MSDTYRVWLPALYEERVILAQALLAAAVILAGAGRLRAISIAAVVVSAFGLLAIEGAIAYTQDLQADERFFLEYGAVGVSALTIAMGTALCGWRVATASAAAAIALLALACLPGLLQLVPARIEYYEPLFRRPRWSPANLMSYICVAGLALAAQSLVGAARNPRYWMIAVPTFVSCSAVLLLAKSRGGVLALLISVALISGVVLVRWVLRGHRSRWAAAVLITILASLVAWQMATGATAKQWLARNRLEEPADQAHEARKVDQSIDQRTESWDRALALYSEAPLIGQSHQQVEVEKVRGRTMHTWYGHLLGGYGLVGAALVAAAVAAWLFSAPRWYGVLLACFAGLALVSLSVRPDLEPMMGVVLALGAPPMGAAAVMGFGRTARGRGTTLDSVPCAASRAS